MVPMLTESPSPLGEEGGDDGSTLSAPALLWTPFTSTRPSEDLNQAPH